MANSNKLITFADLEELATRTDARLDDNDAQIQHNDAQIKQNINNIAALRADVESIEIPDIPTNVSEFTNDADYQNATQVQAAISERVSSAYKVGGTITMDPIADAGKVLSKENVGTVYNVNAPFTINPENGRYFLDKINISTPEAYPAGTNVVVVRNSDDDSESGGWRAYVFDILAGFVDTSNLVEKEPGMGLSQNSFTNEDKTKLESLNVADREEVRAMLDRVYGTPDVEGGEAEGTPDQATRGRRRR